MIRNDQLERRNTRGSSIWRPESTRRTLTNVTERHRHSMQNPFPPPPPPLPPPPLPLPHTTTTPSRHLFLLTGTKLNHEVLVGGHQRSNTFASKSITKHNSRFGNLFSKIYIMGPILTINYFEITKQWGVCTDEDRADSRFPCVIL